MQLEIKFLYSLLYLDTITFSQSGSIKRTSSESSEATDIVTLLGLSGGSEQRKKNTVILEFQHHLLLCLISEIWYLFEQTWHGDACSEIYCYLFLKVLSSFAQASVSSKATLERAFHFPEGDMNDYCHVLDCWLLLCDLSQKK